MLFREVAGHDSIKTQLTKMVIDGRVSHAMLFAGPQGTGKLSMALALAQFLNCTNRAGNDSCGECKSCRKFAKLQHPDLHFVFPVVKPDTKTNAVSDLYIAQWRQFVLENSYFSLTQWFSFISSEKGQGMIYTGEAAEIIRKLSLKTFEGEYKVMIIWQPEKMHEVAANKLLKMLEEPPAKTVFILVCENPADLLGTIMSRTQQIRFSRLEDEQVKEMLVTRNEFSEQVAILASRLANGNFVRALEIAGESEEQQFFFEQFVGLMRHAYGRKLFEILKWVDVIAEQSRDRQKSFLLYALRMIRENYVMNFKAPQLNYLTQEEGDWSAKFSPFISDRNAPKMMEELSLAHAHLEQNGNPKIVITDLALKFIILLKE
jgi:DNA polymerase-3 subunit delta'